jgi:outer membrane protein OmpA-like peptidoglycan-associated protein
VDHTADAYDSDLPDGVAGDINTTLKNDGTVSIGTIQGVSDPQDLLRSDLTSLGLVNRDHNPSNLNSQLKDAASCIGARAKAIVPGKSGSDVLGALNGSARILGGAESSTIDVISNGLANAGGLDLRKLLSADMTGKETAEYVVKERNLYLSPLSGAQVTFYGLGDVTSSRSQPTEERRSWLQDFWLNLCLGSGATCDLNKDWIASGAPAKGAAADPEIQFTPLVPPSLTPSSSLSPTPSPTSPPCQTSLPAEELFEPGSSILTSKANNDLTPIANYLRGKPQAVARIEGHTATWGSEEYRATLSLVRAKAVRDRLVNLGVPPSQLLPPKGLGSTQQVAVDIDGNGNLIEPQASWNRRIVITYLKECGGTSGKP